MNQSQHDELARLFSQNMQVSQPPEQRIQSTGRTADLRASEKSAEAPIHFVSTHYTGTAHVRTDTTSEPSRSPPPPYHEALMPQAMYDLLRQNSIDPSALLPNQIHLFQNADHEQRLRLLELWRISPPNYPVEEHLNGTWTSTSIEREEVLARARHEHQQLLERGYREDHMLDTHIPRTAMRDHSPDPISPIREAGEAAWPPAARMRVSSIANSRPPTRYGEAEPYMANGYSENARPRSIDPVWAAAAGLWQAPNYAHAVSVQSSVMADQYGMYEQVRNHADWERLNEHIAREKLGMGVHSGDDYDMEL